MSFCIFPFALFSFFLLPLPRFSHFRGVRRSGSTSASDCPGGDDVITLKIPDVMPSQDAGLIPSLGAPSFHLTPLEGN